MNPETTHDGESVEKIDEVQHYLPLAVKISAKFSSIIF